MQVKQLIDVLTEIQEIYLAADAKKAASDVEEFLTIFDGVEEMTLDEFYSELEKLHTPTKSAKRPKHTHVNDIIVERYVKELRTAELDKEAFTKVFDELQTDAKVRKLELDNIQHQYIGGKKIAASKKKALEAIQKWFNQRRYQADAIEEAGKARPW
ncbi:MAG: hypothetical protein ACRBCJ_00210 [Hyphomicrobiaceae bacterium]